MKNTVFRLFRGAGAVPVVAGLAFAALAMGTLEARAQDYPTKPIRLVSPTRPVAAMTPWAASSPSACR